MKNSFYLAALNSYLGGKRALLPFIFNHLAQIIPNHHWPEYGFADIFAGGCSVSSYAKALGFKEVHANDRAQRSQLLLKGLIENNHQKLRLSTAQRMALAQCEGSGLVQSLYSGKVFSKRHAQALDQAITFIETITDPVEQALLLLLVWRQVLNSVAFGTSVGTSNRPFAQALDGELPYFKLKPKRLQDGSFAHLLEPCWRDLERHVQAINAGIFPMQGLVKIYHQDVFELLPNLQTDILYADPPYAQTTGYEKSNEVLDTVLFGQARQGLPESPFTQRVEALAEMFDLARHIPVWMLSYNDKVVDLETLAALVKAVDPSRAVQASAQTYAHMPHVAKRQNQELLIIAVKG